MIIDGAIYDGTAHNDDESAHTNTNDAVASATSNATAAYGGTNGADAVNDAATPSGRAEWTNAAADTTHRPAITTAAAVCRIRDGISYGEELLTGRGG